MEHRRTSANWTCRRCSLREGYSLWGSLVVVVVVDVGARVVPAHLLEVLQDQEGRHFDRVEFSAPVAQGSHLHSHNHTADEDRGDNRNHTTNEDEDNCQAEHEDIHAAAAEEEATHMDFEEEGHREDMVDNQEVHHNLLNVEEDITLWKDHADHSCDVDPMAVTKEHVHPELEPLKVPLVTTDEPWVAVACLFTTKLLYTQ